MKIFFVSKLDERERDTERELVLSKNKKEKCRRKTKYIFMMCVILYIGWSIKRNCTFFYIN